MPADITKQGTGGLKGLPSLEQMRNLLKRSMTGSRGPTIANTKDVQYYDVDSPMGRWGTSRYDDDVITAPLTDNQIQDTRYENQPWYDTFANGMVKMLGTAGTTFASSLFGLPYGLGSATINGDPSKLWDNDVTQVLADVDKWLEDNFTNYKNTKQQNSAWYDPSNLFSMNFLADDVIKNFGFTLGAAASMAVGAGSLGLISKAFGAVNDISKAGGIGSKIASALFSATGEGMIEARQGVEERNKREIQRLEDELAPEKQAIDQEMAMANEEYLATRGQNMVRGADGRIYDPSYEVYKQRIENLENRRNEYTRKMDAGRQEIEESGKRMGNAILAGNQVLLTAGNLIQFGKAISKSFNNARHAAETAARVERPFGVGARRVGANLSDGYKIWGKALGKNIASFKGIATEGSEEMNQQWIQGSAGNYYNKGEGKAVNDYWKARLNSDSYKETTEGLYSIGNAISKGFKDSWKDLDQWEQFVIGGITGLAGSYSPTKLFNQDKSKSYFNPMRYGSWEGGAYNERKEFRDKYNKYEESINDLNKVLAQQDFGRRIQSHIAHTYLEKNKEYAAQENDKKLWKDEDDKQIVHDIQAFLRAGKLDDLRAIYDEMGKDMSDEMIDSIIKNTTKETSAEEDKREFDAIRDQDIAERQANIDKFTSQLEGLDPDSKEAQTLREDITQEQKAIDELNQEKANYVGEKKLTGSSFDANGQLKTRDQIREEIKHNAQEMQRKLDSYLDSMEYVRKLSGGQFTKDQEDNLTYLHNIHKEKIARFDKIMARVRKQLPSTFYIKTSKTPEQLAKENASSDLSFTVDNDTPKGYVKVDTSLMKDKNFGEFFMDTVLRGGNIDKETRETAAVKEEEKQEDSEEVKKQKEKVADLKKKVNQGKAERKSGSITAEREAEIKKNEEDYAKEKEALDKLVKEQEEKRVTTEQKKRQEEAEKEKEKQRNLNVENYKNNFVKNYMRETNATAREALDEFRNIAKDIYDASVLENESQEFWDTFWEYRLNPEKVDDDKAKEEKKVTDKKEKEDISKLTTEELAKRTDLKELLKRAKDESDISLINKIKRAMIIREQKAVVQSNGRNVKGLDGYSPEDKEAALKLQIQKLSEEARVEDKDTEELTAQEIARKMQGFDDAMVEEVALDSLNPVERAAMERLAVEDPDEYTERLDQKKASILSIADKIDEFAQVNTPNIDGEVDENLATPKQKEALERKIEGENPEPKSPPKSEKPVNPVISVPVFPTAAPVGEQVVDSINDDEAIEKDKSDGTLGIAYNKSGEHPWRSATRRVGSKSNTPYSEVLEQLINITSDPAQKARYQKQLDRISAIEDFYERTGVFAKNEGGEIKANQVVKFKIIKEINDKTKDFVIFITDENGVIIGDLPSGDTDIEPGTNSIPGLSDLYEEAKKQWDALSESERENPNGYTLKNVESRVNNTYVGKVRYGETRKTVADLFSGQEDKPLFAVMRNSEGRRSLYTGGVGSKVGPEEVFEPITGKEGQPYVLIPTGNSYGIIHYFAVPVGTPQFKDIPKDSIFYKKVREALEKIRDGKLSSFDAKRVLQALFGVQNVHINFDGEESKKGEGISITTFVRESGVEKGNPHDLYKGKKADMDIDKILDEMGNLFINIYCGGDQGINGSFKISKRESSGGIRRSVAVFSIPNYNEMIAEIATTNADTPHTVNDFFTVVPLKKTDNGLKPVEKAPQRMQLRHGNSNTVQNVTVTYKDGTQKLWSIHYDNDFEVRDTEGKPINKNSSHTSSEKEMAAIYRAEAFGRYYMKDFSHPFAVLIDGSPAVYDPSTRSFKTQAQLEKDPKYVKGENYGSKMAVYESMQEFLNNSLAEVREQLGKVKRGDNNRGQNNLPGPEVKMDIWAGSSPQNADLSNLAKRPFTLQLFEGEAPIQFNSVEQAFQYTKFRLLSQYLGFEETKPFLLSDQKLTGEDYKDNLTKYGRSYVKRGVKAATLKSNVGGLNNLGDSYEEEKKYIDEHIQKILSTKSDSYDFEVKNLGGKNGGYVITGNSGNTFLYTIWSGGELVAEDVMEAAMKASFQQNPQALQRLLSTGNATLTHVRGGEWKEAMPRLLMKVRDEFRNTQQPSSTNPQSKQGFKRFGPNIKDYIYGGQDNLPILLGTMPDTGERIRVQIGRGRYVIYIDRELPGETNYKPGVSISYDLAQEEGQEALDKAVEKLGLPKEFLDDLPKLHELNTQDVRNNTETKNDYLRKEWGIVYGHNDVVYKEIKDATILKIQKDSKEYVLCDINGNENPDGDFYKDKDGFLYARVTSMVEGAEGVQPFKEKTDAGEANPWIMPSTTIGNQVDEFVRAFFDGEPIDSIPTPNLSEESREQLIRDLQRVQNTILDKGYQIISRDIKAKGLISVRDNNDDALIARVAGTLDLLLYNPETGAYEIWDIKTHRGKIEDKIPKWTAQISLYKQLLEAEYPELKGKIKFLRVLPFKVSGYDAENEKYTKKDGVVMKENGEPLKVNVKYDDILKNITEKNLNIDMSKPGFKEAYNTVEGRKQIIFSKPVPKPGEAPKQKIKEGIVKTINKISEKKAVKTYLKDEFKENKEALELCEIIDKARKDNTITDLLLTEAAMGMVSNMLNEKLINNHALREKLNNGQLRISGEAEDDGETKGGEEIKDEDVEAKAKELDILNSRTAKAWNKLTAENKRKAIASPKKKINSIKDILTNAARKLSIDPNTALEDILHRKAIETSGYQPLDMEKEMKWLNHVLPQLSSNNKVRIIKGLIKCSDGTWDYGQLKNGMIYIATEGKQGTVYHEAFHAVTQWILTNEELDELYNAARKKYGNLDTVVLEEKMADDFMLYTMGVNTQQEKKTDNIFRRLWRAIKNMFKKTSMIDKLYANINNGVYAEAALRSDTNEFEGITKEDREVSMKYNFLDKESRSRLSENNINKEQFEVLNNEEKNYLFHCVI